MFSIKCRREVCKEADSRADENLAKGLPRQGQHMRFKRKTSPSPATEGADSTLVAFKSEMGWMAAVFRGAALTRLTFGHRTRDLALQAMAETNLVSTRTIPTNLLPMIEQLQRFAAGEADDLLELEVDYGVVTPFERKVLDACRAIPAGETLSYGQLAVVAGAPGAARAVGTVMRKNRLPLVVPCHRVVASCGLGGYSGPEGVQRKQRLLEREGAILGKS